MNIKSKCLIIFLLILALSSHMFMLSTWTKQLMMKFVKTMELL